MIEGENPNMGIGDEIMASGHALSVHRATRKRIIITGRNHIVRWSGMWQGLSWIVHPREVNAGLSLSEFKTIQNGAQCRPYIRYPFNRQIGMTFSGWWRARDHVGAIKFLDPEIAWADEAAAQLGPFIVIEPNIKPGSNPNKQWGRDNWIRIADLCRTAGFAPITMGPPGTNKLPNAAFVESPDFRHGAALLQRAAWAFLPDGGLHHAAGAMGLPVTVLFGGVNDPEFLGYPEHQNIFVPRYCGRWMPCSHCRTVWRSIRPDRVFEQAREQPLWGRK